MKGLTNQGCQEKILRCRHMHLVGRKLSNTELIWFYFLLFLVKVAEGNPWPLALIARENSQHLAMLPLVSSPNDVWEMSAEIPYWWYVTTQIWVVVLIGRAARKIWFNQLEALPRSGSWHVISIEFLRSFLKHHLAGKPVVVSPNVGCFLRLWPLLTAPCN